MKATVEPLEGNKVKVSVEVDETEFEKALDAAFRRIAQEVRVPGFRPGKAPRKLLEARVGKEAARQEAFREALPAYYLEALRETEVDAIAPPDIDITAGEQDGPVVFDAVVEVRPQVAIPGYQGLQVTVPNPAVTDDEVQQQIDRLRRQQGELTDVERAADTGDYVTIDLHGTTEGSEEPALNADDYLHEVGSGTVVEELDANLIGAKAGDILTFDAEVPSGEKVAFRVLVKGVKELVLPEADDTWASEMSEFETLDALRDDLRTRMGGMKRAQAWAAVQQEAVTALAQLVAEDAPEPLVQAELERRLHDLQHRLEHQGADIGQYLAATGQSGQEFVDSLREPAATAVKADLALRALADAEGIEVTDEDVEREIEQVAQQVGQKPQQVRRQLERNEQLPTVRSDIRKAKALEWLVEHVELVDEAGQPIDRDDIRPAAETTGESV